MPKNYDAVDLSFNWAGDFEPGPDGDILDTSSDGIEAVKQQISNIVRSQLGDWEFAPQLGAGLEDFVGEKNSRETARAIEKNLFRAITWGAHIATTDLTVKVAPLSHDTIAVIIGFRAMPTTRNSLEEPFVRISFVYAFGSIGIRL